MTIKFYSCHNEARPDENTTYPANNGYKLKLEGDNIIKIPLLINIPFNFSIECKYDKSKTDIRCYECKHG